MEHRLSVLAGAENQEHVRARDFFKIYGSLLILHLAVVYVGESELLMRLSKYLLVFSLLVWYSGSQEPAIP